MHQPLCIEDMGVAINQPQQRFRVLGITPLCITLKSDKTGGRFRGITPKTHPKSTQIYSNTRKIDSNPSGLRCVSGNGALGFWAI